MRSEPALIVISLGGGVQSLCVPDCAVWWAARYDRPLERSAYAAWPFQSRRRWVKTRRQGGRRSTTPCDAGWPTAVALTAHPSA